MKKSFPYAGLCAILVLLLLLTNPQTSFSGASQGLVLWSQTVLPTLLPFMICSNLIVSLGGIPLLIAPARPFLKRFLGLSDCGCYVLISGLLCGYPMGAKTCSEFYESGRISLSEARCLLAISNHPSPMFLLGYVAACADPAIPMTVLLLALYLPILPLSWCARLIYQTGGRDKEPKGQGRTLSFDEIMMTSMEVMVRIGGYIMVFSILAAFIKRMPAIPGAVKALALGFVEITTGIQAVTQTFSGDLQGLCLTLIIAFGGLSGIYQTKSVLNSSQPQKAGLSIRHYLFWKCIHGALSALLLQCLQRLM